jgi:hypothetical protein
MPELYRPPFGWVNIPKSQRLKIIRGWKSRRTDKKMIDSRSS